MVSTKQIQSEIKTSDQFQWENVAKYYYLNVSQPPSDVGIEWRWFYVHVIKTVHRVIS